MQYNQSIIETKENESVHLNVGARGGYSWEIKIIDEQINDKTLARLAEIDAKLTKQFKQQEVKE